MFRFCLRFMYVCLFFGLNPVLSSSVSIEETCRFFLVQTHVWGSVLVVFWNLDNLCYVVVCFSFGGSSFPGEMFVKHCMCIQDRGFDGIGGLTRKHLQFNFLSHAIIFFDRWLIYAGFGNLGSIGMKTQVWLARVVTGGLNIFLKVSQIKRELVLRKYCQFGNHFCGWMLECNKRIFWMSAFCFWQSNGVFLIFNLWLILVVLIFDAVWKSLCASQCWFCSPDMTPYVIWPILGILHTSRPW